MRRLLLVGFICSSVVAASSVALSVPGCGTSGGSGGADMALPDMAVCTSFVPTPECDVTGVPIKPLMGDRQVVISSLKIADFNEGFDLNCDGKVDNKLAPLGAVANASIMQSFNTQHNIILPLELFGYTGQASSCAKFAFYVGRINEDKDNDGAYTSWESGSADCYDTNGNIHPGMSEDLTNFVDDDCDGYADNPVRGTAPNDVPDGGTTGNTKDTVDHDGDGVSIADGDCDDRSDTPEHMAIAKTRYPKHGTVPAAVEICGNGIDENCDGIADNTAACDPFANAPDGGTPNYKPSAHVGLVSFANPPTTGLDGGVISPAGLLPEILFKDGTVTAVTDATMMSKFCSGATGCFQLNAGPDQFSLALDVQDFMVTLKLDGARVTMMMAEMPGGTYVTQGILAGVLEANTLAQIHIDAGGILTKDQSLLDGVFVGPVATILGLNEDADGHYLPDIDVDGDGLETFWQDVPDSGAPTIARVDRCKDGDGTIYEGTDCPLKQDAKGNYLFVDGLSTALKFKAVPATLSDITTVGIGK